MSFLIHVYVMQGKIKLIYFNFDILHQVLLLCKLNNKCLIFAIFIFYLKFTYFNPHKLEYFNLKYIFSSYVQGLDILILKAFFPISSEVRVKAICINEEKLQKDFKPKGYQNVNSYDNSLHFHPSN